MAHAMAEQRELLTRLVEDRYPCRKAMLHPISPYMLEDRGIYRVAWEDGTSSVLRAFLDDVTAELTGQASILAYLQQRGLPVPQVKHTRDGTLLAHYQSWTALVLSFLEGELADFELHSLELLAEHIGLLHTLSLNVLLEAESTSLPDSRLRPTEPASQAIDNLTQALPHVPEELHQFCADSLEALQRIQQAQRAGLLPETLIHGDCWPGNAVRTSAESIALIDWDCAGIGPAILDVGYLLLACHLSKPQLPAMQPDEPRIAAVVRGYCRQRRPSEAELGVLEDALWYDVARRAGLEQPLSSLNDGWTEEVWLQKMLARYRVGPQIAEIALRCFEQEQ